MTKLISFGFRNGRPDVPDAAIIDVRPFLRANPHHFKPLKHVPVEHRDRDTAKYGQLILDFRDAND